MNSKYYDSELKKHQALANQKSTFLGKNYWVKFGFIILYPFVALWSIFTQGSNLMYQFESTFNNFTAVIIAVVVVVLFIEIGKCVLGYAFFDDLFDGSIFTTKEETIVIILKFIGMLIFFYFSITLSLDGGVKGAYYYKEKTSPPTLLSTDSVSNYYDAKIADQIQMRKQFENTKWKGTITVDARREITKINKRIETLENDREKAVITTVSANEASMETWNEKTMETGVWFKKLAGVGEVAALIILLFFATYKNGVKRELKNDSDNSEPHFEKGFQGNISSTNQIDVDALLNNKNNVQYTAFSGRLNDINQNPIPKQPEPHFEKGFQEEDSTTNNTIIVKNKQYWDGSKWWSLDKIENNIRTRKSKMKKASTEESRKNHEEHMNRFLRMKEEIERETIIQS